MTVGRNVSIHDLYKADDAGARSQNDRAFLLPHLILQQAEKENN
jgi:hypothetical protein